MQSLVTGCHESVFALEIDTLLVKNVMGAFRSGASVVVFLLFFCPINPFVRLVHHTKAPRNNASTNLCEAPDLNFNFNSIVS